MISVRETLNNSGLSSGRPGKMDQLVLLLNDDGDNAQIGSAAADIATQPEADVPRRRQAMRAKSR
jgi:hypothetical protein